MNSRVKVAVADATTGSVIVKSENNADWGYVRLEQTRLVIEDSGFMKSKVVSALVHGTISELQKAGFYAGQELPGGIYVKESLEPFNKVNPERDLKIAGSTGIVCTLNGQPIFRKTYYTMAANAQDVIVKHDNVDQIRAAYDGQPSTAINANTNFDNI
jgi:hypothetical protein